MMSHDNIDIFRRALAREKASRKQAEHILEEKSTELYHLTQQLKESNEKLELLLNEKTAQLQGVFENINDAYLVMNLNGEVLKMNDTAIDLFGYNIDEEKLSVLDLIYKDDSDYAFKSFNQLLEKGYFSDYTARVNTKFKGVRWIHINASIIFDRHKKPIAAQGIIRDITEDKRNNELIEEQKEQLHAIVHNSPVGIVLTQHGRILTSNESFRNTLGYSEEELSKLKVEDISFQDDYVKSKTFNSKMEIGELDHFVTQKRYKRKNNSVVWAKTNVSAIRDSLGNIKYQVALVEDITLEREQSIIIEVINDIAKAILGKIDIYEIASEITNIIAGFLDTDDCVIYLVDQERERLEQIAKYGQKFNGGKRISSRIMIPFGEGIVGSVAKSGRAEIVKDTSKDPRYFVDEERRFSEITVPILYEDEVIGIIDSEHLVKNYYTHDHMRTLKNIASLVSMQLKSAIHLRERDRAEAKNQELLSALEKSNDELEEYAHIVSHDLKSPLRSISALVSWIKEDNKDQFDDLSVQNFDLIEVTLEKMEQLISDVLNYSSLGVDNIEKSDINLNEMVKNLVAILYVPEHIEIRIMNTLPNVIGDKFRLHQLFQNLIVNAIKYNDKEKGLIEIGFSDMDDFWQFYVKDNGKGIDQVYFEKIFRTFEKLEYDSDSSGIGLSVVKKIVELYGGKIWLSSEVKKSTIFYFTLKKETNGKTSSIQY